MTISSRNRKTSGTVFRAVLAMLFLVLMSSQPFLFATASATGLDGAARTVAETSMHADSGHVQLDAAMKGHHRGDKTTNDKGCEVHCSMVNAVLVDCPDIVRTTSHCFALPLSVGFSSGEYGDVARPPRHLI